MKLPPIPEKQFQAQVIELAKLCGYRIAHFRPAMTKSGKWVTPVAGDAAGFPDLVLVRGNVNVLWGGVRVAKQAGRTIFAELKTEKGKPTPAQQEWMFTLQCSGSEVYLWRPSQLEEIKTILMADRSP